jgi:hypothetical protein
MTLSTIKLLPYYQKDYQVKSNFPRPVDNVQNTSRKTFQGGQVLQPDSSITNRIITATHWIEGAKNLHTYSSGQRIEIRPMQTRGLLIDIYT